MPKGSFPEVELDPYQLALWYMREVDKGRPFHLWGGKRLAEEWNATEKMLSMLLQGPTGLEDWVILGTGKDIFSHVSVNNEPGDFCYDPDSQLVFGKVIYTKGPVLLEAYCKSMENSGDLPVRTIMPDMLITEFYGQRKLK